MHKQFYAVIFTIVILIVPTVMISYAMTSDSLRTKSYGFYGLAVFLILVSVGFFYLGATGINTSGYIGTGFSLYGAYLLWKKAKEIKIAKK